MKKSLIIALAGSVMIVACQNSTKNTTPGGYTIEGTIKGMDTGWIFLEHQDSTGHKHDSVRIKDQKFVFTGRVPNPMEYSIFIRRPNTRPTFNFFLEDTSIQINVNKDSLGKSVVMGSPIEDTYVEFNKELEPIYAKCAPFNEPMMEAYRKRNRKTIDSVMKLMQPIFNETDSATAVYAEKNPSSIVSAWAICQHLLHDVNDIKMVKRLYAKFPEDILRSTYARKIKKKLDWEGQFEEGKPVLDITENDTTGKPVSLASFKGKYVLVDFWASWCGPCRHENPNIIAAYKKYKSKNFTVYSISLDDNKQAWEKAIKEDGLTWTHVSDLKGWENFAASGYHIQSIPFNILIDKEGKIVAHNLRGDDLEKALTVVIK